MARAAIPLAAAMLGAGCASGPSAPPPDPIADSVPVPSPATPAPSGDATTLDRWKAEGRAAAEREIAEGRPCFLTYGLPLPGVEVFDASSGLPCYSMGCTVTPGLTAFRRAHNEAVREALRDGRLTAGDVP